MVTLTSITVTWDAPVASGGRSDTRYSVWYQERASMRLMFVSIVNVTTETITGKFVQNWFTCSYGKSGFTIGLHSGVEYVVFVNAENGVSHMAFSSPNITGFNNQTTFSSRSVVTNTGRWLLYLIYSHYNVAYRHQANHAIYTGRTTFTCNIIYGCFNCLHFCNCPRR